MVLRLLVSFDFHTLKVCSWKQFFEDLSKQMVLLKPYTYKQIKHIYEHTYTVIMSQSM